VEVTRNVRIRGKTYSISKEEVNRKLKEIDPEPIRCYYVELFDERYPIKQILSRTLGLPKAGFTTQDAYSALSRLGYEIKVSEDYL